jgi:large repetitive protein
MVLISLCGSPAPSPPGSVSGIAFYDANRNGIHDSCDRPLGLATVAATSADGSRQTATSDVDGSFHIDKVPVGQTVVALSAPNGEIWRYTTVAADGTPGAVVQVKEMKDTGGVEIGASSPSPLSATQISVSGIIFHDANGNGRIDKDECGIPLAWASVTGNNSGASPSADGTFFFYNLATAGTVYPNLPDPGWVATTGGPGDDPCSAGSVPTSWQGTTVYETNIGFKRGTVSSTISGTLYNDANSNGVRDNGEAGLPNVNILLEPTGAHCGGYSPGDTTTGPEGAFVFRNVPPGLYGLYLNGPP